jgi:hypothetical protein
MFEQRWKGQVVVWTKKIMRSFRAFGLSNYTSSSHRLQTLDSMVKNLQHLVLDVESWSMINIPPFNTSHFKMHLQQTPYIN